MSHRILVVDDTKFMRKMLTDMLKQFGYEVVGEADNGRQAVEKFIELRPDVVMLDITMPEMDGIEAMREMRKVDPAVTVLICSAMSQQDLISDALKAGANGYVMKPFKPNRVHEIIRKYAIPTIYSESPSKEAIPLPPVEKAAEAGQAAEPAAEPVAAEAMKILPFRVPAQAAENISSAEPEQIQEPEQVQESAEAQKPEPQEEPTCAEESSQEEPATTEVDMVQEEMNLNTGSGELRAPIIMDLELPEQVNLLTVEEKELLLDIVQDINGDELDGKSLADLQDDLTLDDLNDLTLLLAEEETALEIPQTSTDLIADVSVEDEVSVQVALAPADTVYDELARDVHKDRRKMITLNWGNTKVKNFTSSYMCNWAEELNGQTTNFLVVCTESENRISIEAADENNQFQQIQVTLDGFKQLMAWLEDKLNAGSNIRELSKKAEM